MSEASRLLHYQIQGSWRIEDAINRMTLASADRFGLEGRGALLPGKAADVVVFDPKTTADTPPTGAQPAGRPKGIKYVLINGQKAVEDEKYIEGSRPGKVLRS